MNAHERGCYVDDAGICTCGLPIPDQSDTLAQAQAKAAEFPEIKLRIREGRCPNCGKHQWCYCTEYEQDQARQAAGERRCIFHHSVPADQGYEIKAGFVCFTHSHDFDGGL